MQISNGCNVLNIAGNPKNISMHNLHFREKDQKLKDDQPPF